MTGALPQSSRLPTYGAPIRTVARPAPAVQGGQRGQQVRRGQSDAAVRLASRAVGSSNRKASSRPEAATRDWGVAEAVRRKDAASREWGAVAEAVRRKDAASREAVRRAGTRSAMAGG